MDCLQKSSVFAVTHMMIAARIAKDTIPQERAANVINSTTPDPGVAAETESEKCVIKS